MSYLEFKNNFKSIDLREMRPKGFLERITKAMRGRHREIFLKNSWMEIKYCPVCNSRKRMVEFRKFGVEIFGCKKCSLRYSGIVPLKTEDIYSAQTYLPDMIKNYVSNERYRKQRFGKERVDLISSHIKLNKKPKILDVGCGTGWFLQVAKESGFEIYGQELGKELAQWTSKRLGIEIWDCPLNKVNTEKRFEVITIFDVIEHVKDPLLLIMSAKKILANKGIIVIFTPNFDSLAISIMKERSNLIVPTEHLVYFTKNSIIKLAEKSKMEVLSYTTNGIDLGDLKAYYDFLKDSKMAFACSKLYDYLQPVIDLAEAGNHLRVVLRNKIRNKK